MERDTFGLPRLELPPEPAITEEELRRRHKIAEEIRRLRAKMGPIGLTWEELTEGEDAED